MKLTLTIATYKNRRFHSRTQLVDLELPDGEFVQWLEIFDALLAAVTFALSPIDADGEVPS